LGRRLAPLNKESSEEAPSCMEGGEAEEEQVKLFCIFEGTYTKSKNKKGGEGKRYENEATNIRLIGRMKRFDTRRRTAADENRSSLFGIKEK